MKPEMTLRERILAAINHQPCDRVPTDYCGVIEITEKLMKHFGVSDMPGLADAMDIDMVMFVDPVLKPSKRTDVWDVEYIKVPLSGGIGFYDEPATHPLAEPKPCFMLNFLSNRLVAYQEDSRYSEFSF